MDKIIFTVLIFVIAMTIVSVATVVLNIIFKWQDKEIRTRNGGWILLANLRNTDCSIKEADAYMRLTNSIGNMLNTGVKNDWKSSRQKKLWYYLGKYNRKRDWALCKKVLESRKAYPLCKGSSMGKILLIK